MTQLTQGTELVTFNPTEVATFGNRFLGLILAHEIAREDAEKAIADAEKREDFIDIELTKAALALQEADKIDLFQIYGGKDYSAALYKALLVEIGVYRVETDKLHKQHFVFTDDSLAEAYEYDDDLKKSDETEYKRRHSRRVALNVRLARCCKAALALFEAGATMADVQYKDNEDGTRSPVITKGPVEVMGNQKEVVIHSKNTALVEGATVRPTLGSLAKFSDDKHKEKPAKEDAGSAGNIESQTRKAGEGGTSEQDFLALANAFLMAVRGREGQFSETEIASMKNVLTEVSQYANV